MPFEVFKQKIVQAARESGIKGDPIFENDEDKGIFTAIVGGYKFFGNPVSTRLAYRSYNGRLYYSK